MTYEKTNWIDKEVEKPLTYRLDENPDGTTTLYEAFGRVITEGTPLNAFNLNKIENAIEEIDTATGNKMNNPMSSNGDLIVGGIAGVPTRLKSGTANQVLTSDSAGNVGWADFIVDQDTFAPSDIYIDLELQGSDATYTAPADGWYMFTKQTNYLNQFTYMQNTSNGLAIQMYASFDGAYCQSYLPIKKGQQVRVSYTALGETIIFRFIYAEGSKP